MKIEEAIRAAYTKQRRVADRLKIKVDGEIENNALASWHYESRVKTVESYALKVECGRPGNPEAVEDLFACVIVDQIIWTSESQKTR